MKFLTLFLSLIVPIHSALAFNWSRCQSAQPVTGSADSAIVMISTTVMNSLVQSSQFTSSWGECSLIGEAEKVRRTFIAQNHPYLLEDITKGRGEYLDAYAKLHGCSLEGNLKSGEHSKARYLELRDADLEGFYLILKDTFLGIRELCPLA